MESLFINLSDVSDQGFTEIKPGRYGVKDLSPWVIYTKSDTGNRVLRIPLEITQGEYAGETTALFHAMTEKSRGYFLLTMRTLGYIRDGDRERNPEKFGITLQFGKTNERGETEITAIVVGSEVRPVGRGRATAVIVAGDRGTRVEKLEPPTVATPGVATAGGSTPGSQIPAW